MAKPNKPYLAGTATIGTGVTDYAFFEQIFAAAVLAAEVSSWRDLIVGVGNTFLFTFNKQITVKYGYITSPSGASPVIITKGDAAIWRNPTPSTLYRTFEDIQRRDNHTFNMDEIYISNSSGGDVVVDVEIFANNNGPFLN